MNDREKTKQETKGGGTQIHKRLGNGWVSSEGKGKERRIFLGEYKHKVDNKGRVALPIKFRNELKEGVVITRGLDNCLFVYVKSDWQELAGKISKLPLTQANARAFARLMLAGAKDVEIDNQGRINLPQYLMDYARVKNKIIITGVYNRLEIWSRGRWGRYKKNAEENSSEIAEKLSDLGI